MRYYTLWTRCGARSFDIAGVRLAFVDADRLGVEFINDNIEMYNMLSAEIAKREACKLAMAWLTYWRGRDAMDAQSREA